MPAIEMNDPMLPPSPSINPPRPDGPLSDVVVACPECGANFKASQEHLGRPARCKQCGASFLLSSGEQLDRAETRGNGEYLIVTPPPIAIIPPPPPLGVARQAWKAVSKLPVSGASRAVSAAFGEQPRPLDAPAPSSFGRFQIRDRLGAGGFGEVYQAYDPVLERDVALKVPHAAVLANEKARARFVRESRVAAQLRHPGIVPIFDAGSDGDAVYIAYAFIQGRTLEDEVEQQLPDFRRSAELVRRLAEAAHHAHSLGIVHRDIKPSNIMVDGGGQALLMDFGLAHIAHSEDKMTRDGAVLGTPAYMAPEQADRSFGEVGPASDQFSLGIVLYELLTGKRPFNGPPQVVIYNLTHQEPPPPSSINPIIPRDLETICLKAIAKQPAGRYADCEALAEDLRRFLDDENITARRLSLAQRAWRWSRREPLVASLAASLFAVMAAGIIAVTAQWRRADGHREEAEANARESKQAQDRAEASEHESRTLLARRERDLYLKNLVLARERWQDNDIRAAQELLNACPPELRNWEWRFVRRLCESILHQFPKNHSQKITSVAYSPDGEWIVTGGYDRSVLLWNAESSTFHASLGEMPWNVTSVAFSPTGDLLAAGDLDGNVRLWNVGEWRDPIHEFKSEVPVWSMTFTPGGALVIGCLGNTIKLYDVKARPGKTRTLKPPLDAALLKPYLEDPQRTAQLLASLMRGDIEFATGPTYVATSADGKWVVSAGFDRKVHLWRVQEVEQSLAAAATGGPPTPRLMLEVPQALPFMSVAVDAEGDRIAAGSANGVIYTWEVDDGAVVARHALPDAHQHSILGLVFARDQQRLASCSFDRTIKIWDDAGELTAVLRGNSSAVWVLALSPDGRQIASGNETGELLVWDASATEETMTLATLGDSAKTIALGNDGRSAAWLEEQGRVFSLDTVYRRHGTLTAPDGIDDVKLVALGDREVDIVLAAEQENAAHVYLYLGDTTADWLRLPAAFDTVTAIAIRSGTVGVADIESIRLFSAQDGRQIAALENSADALCLDIREDGSQVAAGDSQGLVRLWDAATGKLLDQRYGAARRVFDVAFSPIGLEIASAHEEGVVRLWDPQDDQDKQLNGHRLAVHGVTFSPDGTRIASAGDDGNVMIWDSATGEAALTLERGGVTPFRQVRFGQDGALTATRTDGAICRWKAPE